MVRNRQYAGMVIFMLVAIFFTVGPVLAETVAGNTSANSTLSNVTATATTTPANVTTEPTATFVTTEGTNETIPDTIPVTTTPATKEENAVKNAEPVSPSKDTVASVEKGTAGNTSGALQPETAALAVRWSDPTDLVFSPPRNGTVAAGSQIARTGLLQAGYGAAMVQDPKTGLLHLSYIEYSNSSESPGKLIYQTGTGSSWNESVIVDETIGFYHREVPESVRHTSIALGPDGKPRIVYMSWDEGYQLKYARMKAPDEPTAASSGNTTGQMNAFWQIVTVPNPPAVSSTLYGWGASIAVDNQSTAHISFLRQDGMFSQAYLEYVTARLSAPDSKGTRKVQFTHKDLTGIFGGLPMTYWKEPVKAGMVTSIALDSANRPRISYSGSTDGLQKMRDTRPSGCGYTETCYADLGLDYASTSSTGKHTSWAIVSLNNGRMKNPARHNVLYSSMAIDTRDNLHISSSDCGDGKDGCTLYYTIVNGTGIARTETVARSSNGTGMSSSIRLDPGGNPRIAYTNGDHGAIRFAARMDGTWKISAPPSQSPPAAAEFVNLALDSAGNPSIVYLDPASGRLKYLYGNLPA
jgi:hypothetical protein